MVYFINIIVYVSHECLANKTNGTQTDIFTWRCLKKADNKKYNLDFIEAKNKEICF